MPPHPPSPLLAPSRRHPSRPPPPPPPRIHPRSTPRLSMACFSLPCLLPGVVLVWSVFVCDGDDDDGGDDSAWCCVSVAGGVVRALSWLAAFVASDPLSFSSCLAAFFVTSRARKHNTHTHTVCTPPFASPTPPSPTVLHAMSLFGPASRDRFGAIACLRLLQK